MNRVTEKKQAVRAFSDEPPNDPIISITAPHTMLEKSEVNNEFFREIELETIAEGSKKAEELESPTKLHS